MATWYETAPDDVASLAKQLIRRSHHDLIKAEATITYLFARNNDGPALTKNSWPAKAIAKINSLRDRVAGLADCMILIDGKQWQDWSAGHRVAVLDHELHHFEVCFNKAGAIRYDDANRPKIRIRPHDFEFGGFHLMAQRHGTDSAEIMAVSNVSKIWVQMELPFMGEASDEDDRVVQTADGRRITPDQMVDEIKTKFERSNS